MTACDYFHKVSPKQWCILDALKKYEDQCQILGLNNLCERIASDLSVLENGNKPSEKGVAAIPAMKAKLETLRSIKSFGLAQPIAKKPELPVQVADNINIHNNGGKYTNSIKQIIKKRKVVENKDESDVCQDKNVYIHSPSSSRAGSSNNAPQDVEPLDEIRRANHQPTQLVLTHGQKSYTIRTPSRATQHSPHRPKVTQSHLDALKEYFVFATTFAMTGDSLMLVDYKIEQDKQRGNRSLVELGVFDFINDTLKNVPHDCFPETLWSSQYPESNEATAKFLRIAKYVLTGYHLLSHSSGYQICDHERTFFIEYVIPGLMAISKTSDLFDFYWCEYEMQAVKEMDIFDKDFNLMKTQRRYIDALGKMTAGSEMEIVIVEASSGPFSENVQHSIEDTLKTFECTTSSLSVIASKYRHASIDTFMKLQILSIQVIKNKMTLSTTSLNDAYTWKRMDLRVAEIPTTWSDRINMLRYFELLATLMNRIQTCIKVQEDLKNENIGSEFFDGKTVEEVLNLC